MDEQSKGMLMKYLEIGAEKLESGAQFIESEIPLVVSEYLNWIFYYNLISLMGGLVIILLSILTGFIAKSNYDYLKNPNSGGQNVFACIFFGLGTLALIIAGSIQFCINLREVVKVSVAPKVVILEKISEISK